MIFNNDKICVSWNRDHNKVIGKGLNGLDLIRADMWLNKEAEEDENSTSRFNENENYLETNPQICTVLHANAKLKYKPGDRLFVHYMAWEWSERTEYGSVIDTNYIFFQIMDDGSFETVNDLYLGEPIYSNEEIQGGIILLGGKKDNLRVKITHVPIMENSRPVCAVGDTVVSIDKNNYEFDYWGTKYIKLTKDEIVGVYVNE